MFTLPDKIEHIFIDLDGVMVDFHSSLVRLHGYDPTALSEEEWSQWDNYGPTGDPETFWAPVRDLGEDWWAQLPKLPWADELWRAAHQACAEVTFLTSPARFPASAAGKYRWVQELYKTRRVLIGKPKQAVAGPHKILIDDRISYLTPWAKAGGVAVGLRRPWNPEGVSPDELIAALDQYATSSNSRGASSARADLSDIDEWLLNEARRGAMRAFLTSPGGNRYGAAVLTTSGSVYSAGQYSSFNHVTNVHAEMGAILAATQAGDPYITKLALTSTKDKGKITRPCGVCRQFILEHAQRTGLEIELIMSDARGVHVDRQPLSAMIPHSWEARPLNQPSPRRLWSSGVSPRGVARLEFGDAVQYHGDQLGIVWEPELWPGHALIKTKYSAAPQVQRDEHGRKLFKYPASFSSYDEYLEALSEMGGALREGDESQLSPWGDRSVILSSAQLEEVMETAPLNILDLTELTALARLLDEAHIHASAVRVTGSWAVGLGVSDSDYDLRITATPGQIKRFRAGISRAHHAGILKPPHDSATWHTMRLGEMGAEALIVEGRFAETFAVVGPRGSARKISIIYHSPERGAPLFRNRPAYQGTRAVEGIVRSEGGHLYKSARFSVITPDEEVEVLCLHKLAQLIRAGDQVSLMGELLTDGLTSALLMIDPKRHPLALKADA